MFSTQDRINDDVLTEGEARPFLWRRLQDHNTNQDGQLELEDVRQSLQAEVETDQDSANISR